MNEVIYVMLYLERKLTRIESNLEHNKTIKLKNDHTKVLKALACIYNYIKETIKLN